MSSNMTLFTEQIHPRSVVLEEMLICLVLTLGTNVGAPPGPSSLAFANRKYSSNQECEDWRLDFSDAVFSSTLEVRSFQTWATPGFPSIVAIRFLEMNNFNKQRREHRVDFESPAMLAGRIQYGGRYRVACFFVQIYTPSYRDVQTGLNNTIKYVTKLDTNQ